MAACSQVPIHDGLFTWPSDEPRLIASQCSTCDVVTFPAQADCPRCAAQAMESIQLPARGVLWTFTTQEFPPKSPPYMPAAGPDGFRPFAVGYVEFPGVVKVEGLLTESDLSKLRIGMGVEVAVVPFRVDENGDEIVTYAFKPVEVEAS